MSHRVLVLETSQSFECLPGETVLGAALRQDVQLAHECTLGGCGTCRVKLADGTVSYDEFPLALTEEEAAQGYALACQAKPLRDLVISVQLPSATSAEPERHRAVVKTVHAVSPDVVHLVLELPNAAAVSYLPGQHMNVFLDAATHRSFSMASMPNGSQLDFHVRRIPGGRFTEHLLDDVRPGHALEVELPLGSFRLHAEDYRPLLMVATGTGLTPIKCILESLLDDPECPPVWLYWGMRTVTDLYAHEVIRSWADRLYEFKYVPVLSRPDSEWKGRCGYVQDAVLEDLPDLSEHSIYLCGSPNMINDAKKAFQARGAEIEHMHAEGFSFQRPVA